MDLSGSDQPIYSPHCAEGDGETGIEGCDVSSAHLKRRGCICRFLNLQGELALWAS